MLKQEAAKLARPGFPWLVALFGLFLVGLVAAGGVRWWQSQRLWQAEQQIWTDYIAGLQGQPGIVVIEEGWRDGKFRIVGLRDPLAIDPRGALDQAGIDPKRVVSRWVTYQGLDPEFVLQRLRASLDPPPSVTLAIAGDRIVAQGSAPSTWLERARTASRM